MHTDEANEQRVASVLECSSTRTPRQYKGRHVVIEEAVGVEHLKDREKW